MSEPMPRHPIALQKLVYPMPDAGAVTVTPDVEYHTTDGERLGLDLYRPAALGESGLSPGVIFVIGVPGAGARAMLGCAPKDMESYVGWARLVAASGMIAITYENREAVADLHAVFDHVRRHAASLGIDPSRLAVWACSGHGPLGLMAAAEESVACAVLLYPYLLDLDGATGVAEALKQWGFVNAGAGKSVDDIPASVPLLIVRAGRDQFAGVNDSIDRFVPRALARDLPITVTNHAGAPHAFDLSDDRPATRAVIRSVLAFLQSRLMSMTPEVATP